MLIANILILLVVHLCAARYLEADPRGHSHHITPNVRIINGRDALPHALPSIVHVVIMRNGKLNDCGGSLIAAEYVLTAAHCLKDSDGVHSISLGVHNYNHSDPHQEIAASKYIIHPGYTGSSSHDIAIIKLVRPASIQVGIVETAGLAYPATYPDRQAAYDGQWVTLYGWGQTDDNPPLRPNVLQTLDAVTVPYSQCSQWGAAQIDALCVARANGQFGVACFGDSGGPLIQAGIQIGVTSKLVSNSVQHPCRDSPFAVYTRVDYHRDWITRVINSP